MSLPSSMADFALCDRLLQEAYSQFSHDDKAALLVSPKKGTVAMLVSPPNPPRIELYNYYANFFFCFR